MGHEEIPQTKQDSKQASDALLIAGPTASGKSELAIEVAKKCGGMVINVDSMQVYGELRIITARPSIEDEKLVPHELYGHVSARSPYSLGSWLEDAGRVLNRCENHGLKPIFVGGTGLYFKGLIEGISDIPQVDQEIRKRIRNFAGDGEYLHSLLLECDPEMAARLNPSDTQRIMRALEVFESTGQSLAKWQNQKTAPILDFDRCSSLILAPNRIWLQDRICCRTKLMLANGALDEAKSLIEMDLPEGAPALRAIGVKTMAAAANGMLGMEEATERCIVETRRYAKRQDTWFRNQFPDWNRLEPEETDIMECSEKIAQQLQN